MYNKGDLRIFYIEWDGEYLPVGCLTSDSFSETSEMLKTTTRGDGNWSYDIPTRQSFNITIDGLLINTNFNNGDFSKISHDRLVVLKRNRTLINWKTADNNNRFVNTGQGHIKDLSDSASVGEFITFSATIQGYGEPINTGAEQFYINDGNDNLIQDGNDNLITTS